MATIARNNTNKGTLRPKRLDFGATVLTGGKLSFLPTRLPEYLVLKSNGVSIFDVKISQWSTLEIAGESPSLVSVSTVSREQSTHSPRQLRYLKLMSKFTEAFSIGSKYVEMNEKEAEDIAKKAINLIVQIPYLKCSLQITPLNDLKFSIIINDNTKVYINQSFRSYDSEKENIVAFSIFIDNHLKVSDTLPLTDLIFGLHNYLKQ